MKLALCVGINDYPGSGSDLSGCVNDANDWSVALAARGFTVHTLLDSNATKAAILSDLRALIMKANYGDIVVFQFSGHGSWVPDESGDEPDARDEVLCPHDIMSGQWISDDELHEAFSDRARGARIVFLSDSCHSGTVNRFVSVQPFLADMRSTRVRFMPPGTFKSALEARSPTESVPMSPTRALASNVSLLLAGSRDTEYSYDAWFGNRANGAFSRAAIDSLAENPLSYNDWFSAIRRRLPTAQYPQTPQISGARYQRLWAALGEGR